MGTKSSKTQEVNSTTTNVTTSHQTTGDIGLTGQNAVNLAGTIGQTSIELERINQSGVNSLINEAGRAFDQSFSLASKSLEVAAKDPVVVSSGGGGASVIAGGPLGPGGLAEQSGKQDTFIKLATVFGGVAALAIILKN